MSTTLAQNRRVMSRSSGFSSSASETVRGSSPIPQIGQLPGSDRTICGCMGQVYSIFVSGFGSSDSSAMPQLGQAPGFGSRTSAHIGQTYASCAEPECLGAAGTGALGVPSVTRPFPTSLDLRYCSGFAWNFCAHPGWQKKYVSPAYSALAFAVAGSTIMPQTGSRFSVEVGVALISTFLALAANANNAEGRSQNPEVDPNI